NVHENRIFRLPFNGDSYLPIGRLIDLLTVRDAFKTMVNTIAQQMGQARFKATQNRLIDFQKFVGLKKNGNFSTGA
ncbi:hypothetical protein ACSTJP_00425, partial [Vibrio parahaemolyticus]